MGTEESAGLGFIPHQLSLKLIKGSERSIVPKPVPVSDLCLLTIEVTVKPEEVRLYPRESIPSCHGRARPIVGHSRVNLIVHTDFRDKDTVLGQYDIRLNGDYVGCRICYGPTYLPATVYISYQAERASE